MKTRRPLLPPLLRRRLWQLAAALIGFALLTVLAVGVARAHPDKCHRHSSSTVHCH